MECPKCGFVMNADFADCPRCGVVAAKFVRGHETPLEPVVQLRPPPQGTDDDVRSLRETEGTMRREEAVRAPALPLPSCLRESPWADRLPFGEKREWPQRPERAHRGLRLERPDPHQALWQAGAGLLRNDGSRVCDSAVHRVGAVARRRSSISPLWNLTSTRWRPTSRRVSGTASAPARCTARSRVWKPASGSSRCRRTIAGGPTGSRRRVVDPDQRNRMTRPSAHNSSLQRRRLRTFPTRPGEVAQVAGFR